jgi:Domain of unknown function (DUF4476)
VKFQKSNKMKKLYLIAAMLFTSIISLHAQQHGNLTVFSEDGDKFFLILNGEKQNEEAQTNIRVEELNQPYYSARIIFEDKTLASITKNNLMIVDADAKFMDVTYKIKKDKNKKVKLNYYSMIPVQEDFLPPSGMYVRQFGQTSQQTNSQQPVQIQGGGRQTTTTTTTTTTNTNSNGIGASLNVPGMNVNISIADPDMDAHTTTTTHHTTTTHIGGQPQQQQQPQYTGNCKGWPMEAADFSAAKKTINESSFDDTKLSTAKSIASSNCLTCDQITQICNLFSFEENKLAFAKFAYKFTTDPKNYFKVNNVFSFSSSKEELNEFIQGQ